ncbi:MAG: serine hydrolase [Candidatus Krumholzibacteria bacterium]
MSMIPILALLWAGLLASPSPRVEYHPAAVQLPLTIKDNDWKPLREWTDPRLQYELSKRLLANKRWRSLIGRGKMSVGLVDLRDPARIRWAQANGDIMLYAASLPKIVVLLAVYRALEDGTLTETESLNKDLIDMIRFSSNAAATRFIDDLGFDRIEAAVLDPRVKFYDPENGGGLWVGKRYAQSGERRPEPVRGLVHTATVTQVCRFYYLLATGRLIDAERSSQMLEVLSQPDTKHKFVLALGDIAPGVTVYRKSGTWKSWHSDSVLVWGEGRHYILVALVDDSQGEQLLRDLVSIAENALNG